MDFESAMILESFIICSVSQHLQHAAITLFFSFLPHCLA